MALPHTGTGFRQAPLLGREAEMEQLRHLLARARDGRGGVVLVAGEAGIGKTRLMSWLAEAAAADGVAVLGGQCYEGGGAGPYLPFVEVIESARRSLAADLVAVALGDDRHLLSRLVPGLTPGMKPQRKLPAEHERPILFNAVASFFARAAGTRPLLLVLEDLQWADDATLLMLRHVGREAEVAPVLVVGTHRSGGEAAGSAASVLEALQRIEAHRLDLRPLPPECTRTLAKALAGRLLPSGVTGAIHELTEGNPFFIGEVVKYLAEEGRLDAPEGSIRCADDLGVPESVRIVVGRRLARVGRETRQVLVSAAVLGRAFDHSLLRKVAAVDGETLIECLDEAEQARLISSGPAVAAPGLRFSHELIRQTLLAEVSLPRRQQLHARALAALEATPGSAGSAALAFHAVRAGAEVEDERKVRYLSEAAESALAATDYETAVDSLRKALELVPDGDHTVQCDLRLRLGEAMRRITDSDEARAVFRAAASAARQLNDPARLARAALGVSRSWPTVGELDEEAAALLRESAASVDDTALRAQLLSRLSLQLFYAAGPGEVQRLSAEAVAAARASGDDVTLARTLQVRHVTLWQPEHLEERLAVAREILAVASRSGVPEIGLWGHRPLIADLMELGDARAAEAESEAYSRLADACRQPIFIWQARIRRAMLATHAGRLGEAERFAGEALEMGRAAGGQNLMAAFGEQMLVIRWLQGRLGELEALARASVNSQPDLVLWRAVLAFILRETGRGAEARQEFERAAASNFGGLPVDDTRLVAVILLSVVSAAIKDSLRAAQLYGMLTPYDGHGIVLSEGVVFLGAASHYLAILAAAMRDFPRAERHFEAALEFNERMAGAPWLAMTQLEYARMLLSRRLPGHRRAARVLLEQALAASRRFGLGAIESGVKVLLDSHVGGAGELPAGLTRREAEILRLLAAGMSNREISDALVLSVRTTARHVTNIYGKIGARNRADATAFALRHGLSGD